MATGTGTGIEGVTLSRYRACAKTTSGAAENRKQSVRDVPGNQVVVGVAWGAHTKAVDGDAVDLFEDVDRGDDGGVVVTEALRDARL